MECTGEENTPPCKQCRAAGEACQQKTSRPSGWWCFKQKVGCSLAEKEKKKKKVEVLMPLRAEKEGSEEMGELVEVAWGILRALQDLVKVGKGIEGEVKRWVEEDFKYQGGWHLKADTMERGVGMEFYSMVGSGREGKEREVELEAEDEDDEEEEEEEEEEEDGDRGDNGGDGGEEGEGV